MTNSELAKVIRSKFVPFAFMCSCNGTDPSCAQVRANAATRSQFETAERIAKFIESLED